MSNIYGKHKRNTAGGRCIDCGRPRHQDVQIFPGKDPILLETCDNPACGLREYTLNPVRLNDRGYMSAYQRREPDA